MENKESYQIMSVSKITIKLQLLLHLHLRIIFVILGTDFYKSNGPFYPYSRDTWISVDTITGSKICVTREDLAHSVSIVSDRWRTRDV